MVTIERNRLADAASIAASVAPKSTPKDILKSLHLRIAADVCEITATDLETSVIQQFACDGDGIDVCLPALKFSQIVSSMSGDSVTLKMDGSNLRLECGRAKFKLPTSDPQEFPTCEPIEGKIATASMAAIAEAVKRTCLATDDDTSRYALAGILWHGEGDLLTLVATDGRRMSSSALGIKGEIHEGCVVPAKPLQTAARIMAGDLTITTSSNRLEINDGSNRVQTRLIEGRFPRWQDVIPPAGDVQVNVVAGALLAALRQAMLTTTEDMKGADIAITGGELTIQAGAAEIGDSTITIPVSGDGEATTRVNPKFLVQWLATVPEGSPVQFDWTSDDKPILLTLNSSRYVVMPMCAKD